ncbi:hypothetical protein K439DRAFT_1621944 [Ramaria rubella]|nr:hypothetical protein K439DRAFT_1621944 [Ramaria rubella]
MTVTLDKVYRRNMVDGCIVQGRSLPALHYMMYNFDVEHPTFLLQQQTQKERVWGQGKNSSAYILFRASFALQGDDVPTFANTHIRILACFVMHADNTHTAPMPPAIPLNNSVQ